MKRIYLASSLILLTAMVGCAEPRDMPGASTCSANCTDAQACINNMCYDTCSLTKPCTAFNAVCQNHICVAKDAECTPNTRKCHTDHKTVLLCKNGLDYVSEKVCGTGETCDMGVCVEDACVEGTKRCRNNNIEVCQNSAFRIYTECEAPQVCDVGSYTCEEPAECTGNIKKCDENGNVVACVDKHWMPHQTCSDGFACDSTSKTCVETATCESGDLKCNGNTAYQCLHSHWQKLGECKNDELCRQGRCVNATCQNGETRCAEFDGLSYVEVCNQSEFFVDKQCMSGQTCVIEDGAATCVTNQCSSLFKCENNTLYKCALNDYVVHEFCASGTYCDAVSGVCQANCGNHVVDAGEDCDGLDFRDGLSCSSAVTNSVGNLKCTKDCKLDASECVTKCESGSMSCSGSIFTECVGGKWQTTDCAASGQACKDTGCYTPSYTGDWDGIQTFENLPESAVAADRYTAVLSFTENGIQWEMQGRRDMDTRAIDGQGLIMRKDDKATNYIQATNLPKGVKKLAFSWRSWGGTSDKGTMAITVGKLETTMEFTNTKEIQTYELEVNDASADTIFIQSTKNARFVIDNLRWTNM